MAELVLRLRVAGNQDVEQALRRLQGEAKAVEARLEPLNRQTTRSGDSTRVAIRAWGDFAQVLSGTSAILSIAARGNKELQDTLEKVTVAFALTSAAINVMRNAAQLAQGAMIGLRVAMAAIAAPVLIAVAAFAALAAVAGVLIKRHLDAASAVRDHASALERAAASAQRFTAATRSLTFLQQEQALSYDDIRKGSFRAAEGIAKLDATQAAAAKQAAAAAKQAAAAAEQAAKVASALRQLRFEAELAQAAFEAFSMQRINSELSDFALRAAAGALAVRKVREELQQLEDAEAAQAAAIAASSLIPINTPALSDFILRWKALQETTRGVTVTVRELGDEYDAFWADQDRRAADNAAARTRQAQEWFEDQGRAAKKAAQDIFEFLHGAITNALFDALTTAQNIFDAIANVAKSVFNEIARMLISFGVKSFLKWIGLAQGGIVQGGLVPAFAGMQSGGIINRPTLAAIGEGGQSEAIVPLPGGRAIPVQFTGKGQEREIKLAIVVHNVWGDPASVKTGPDEIRAVVLNDIQSRGPIMKAIRIVIP